MARNVDKAIDRIEREISSLQRKLDQVNGRLDRADENSYEYGLLGRESSSLSRRIVTLYNELVVLEDQL